MRLSSPLKSIEILLGGAVTTNELQFTGDYDDLTQSGVHISAMQDVEGVTNGTTAVEVFPAPAAGITRQIKGLSIYNADTANADVIVRLNDGTNTFILQAYTLVPAQTLEWNFGAGWGLLADGGSGVVLGSMAVQNANAVDITGGALDDVTIENSTFGTLIMQLAAGLDFTASGGNLFDQFQVGTFTPGLSAATPFSSITYGAGNGGLYVRFPGCYLCGVRVQIATVSGGSGNAVITDLPFVAASSGNAGGCFVVYKNNWAANGPDAAYAAVGSTALVPTYSGSTFSGFVQASDVVTGSDVILVGIIFT